MSSSAPNAPTRALRIDRVIPGVLLAWLAGVALLTMRLAGGWWFVANWSLAAGMVVGFLIWLVVGLVAGGLSHVTYRGPTTEGWLSYLFGVFGAFIGGMHALGLDPETMRERCRAELVRRSPFNDYTLPLLALMAWHAWRRRWIVRRRQSRDRRAFLRGGSLAMGGAFTWLVLRGWQRARRFNDVCRDGFALAGSKVFDFGGESVDEKPRYARLSCVFHVGSKALGVDRVVAAHPHDERDEPTEKSHRPCDPAPKAPDL